MANKNVRVKEGTELVIRDFSGNNMGTWDSEMINTLRDTVAPGATLTELSMFGSVAKRAGLDPFLNEMYFTKIDSKVQMMTSYRGLLKIARQDPNFLRVEGYAVYEKDEIFKIKSNGEIIHEFDPRIDRGKICGAWASVKSESKDPNYIYVSFEEYCQTVVDKKTGKVRPRALWASKPATMIEKVAKSHALREFSGDCGLYTEEEMPSKFENPVLNDNTKELSRQNNGVGVEAKATSSENEGIIDAEYSSKDNDFTTADKVESNESFVDDSEAKSWLVDINEYLGKKGRKSTKFAVQTVGESWVKNPECEDFDEGMLERVLKLVN